jgi:5'-methylthioadenosine phosphorylase
MAPVLAVVGGSGLYEIPELREIEHAEISTPYGPPSDSIVTGRIGATRVLFLPRHGRGHRLAPHAINYRANICALRMLGATHVASISAVGSLREHLAPGDVVLVDQYVDRTLQRISTFFDTDVVAHVSMAEPVCPHLSRAAAAAAVRAGAQVHATGTYVCIEGPQFSTRAESRLYRSWGADVVGMTALPEAKLAREAGLAYATVALVTDFDSWHESEQPVTVEMVQDVMRRNVELARRVVFDLASNMQDLGTSCASHDIRDAIMTDPSQIPAAKRESLNWLLGSR